MELVSRYSLRLSFLLGVSSLALFSKNLSASSVSTEYLDANLNEDGSIYIDGTSSLPLQSTLESLLTFQLLNRLDEATAITSLAALESPTDETSTEFLSYWLMLNQNHGGYPSLLAQLTARQNLDGGFGFLAGYSSDPLNTAVALMALNESGYSSSSAAGAIAYLTNLQSETGSWDLVDKSSGLQTVELTAIVAHSLWKFRHQFSTLSSVDAAISYLQSQKSGALWPTTEASALALNTIVNRLVDRSAISESVTEFSGLQGVNKSFDEDTYITALGLRVLESFQNDPEDISVIRGRVVDAEFAGPIAGAKVSISGALMETLITDSSGFFTTGHLASGVYDVEISQDGFSRIAYKATISEGVKADLGDVKLSKVEVDPVTGEPVVTGFVRGVIKDRVTGAPINGAIVSLASGQSATTNSSGEYSISGVQPGQVTVSVAANNYQQVQGSANIGERQTVVFSPLLNELEDPEIRLSGVITDRQTGASVSGVVITVSNSSDSFSAVTDSSGAYEIESLPTGPLAIQAVGEGYHPVNASAEAAQGNKLVFSPALDSLDTDPEPQLSGFKGQVVDAISGAGISEVAIQVEIGALILNINSDEDGYFEILDLEAGEVQLSLGRPLYLTSDIGFDLSEGVLADLGKIELLSEDDANSGELIGRVIDVRTGAPISGVVVSLTRTVDGSVRETISNESGSFSVAGIGSEEYEIALTKTGYVDSQLLVDVDLNQSLDLGDIRMRQPGLEALLPDLTLRGINKGLLEFDQATFAVSGSFEIKIANTGNSGVQGPINIIAFQDLDGDAIWSASDPLISSELVDVGSLDVDDVATINLTADGSLSFYQAPIVVSIDPNNAIAELSDANNAGSTASTCSGASSAPSVDLALCMDASGSVNSNEFRLQQEGVARALENTEIIPRDGSVRVSVYHFSSGTGVVVEPTVVDDDTAPLIADVVRTTRLFSGGTRIDSCINRVSSDLAQLSPQSALQVIDVSTDGRSSGNPSGAATTAISRGIDVINGIAIGDNTSIPSMESWVRPQPAGGDRGFVVQAPTFESYIEALADKITRETKIVDLNVGGLRLIDNGAESLSSAIFTLGNSGAGAITEGVVVSLYAGVEAIEENKVGTAVYTNGLASGKSAQVTITGIDSTVVSGNKLLAVAELETGFAECNEQNNRQIIEVASLLGNVGLSISESQLSPNTLASLSGSVTNTGSLIGDYQLKLSIEDASNNLVYSFDETTVNDLESGAAIIYAEDWNTGVTLAGEYKAVARLYSTEWVLLDTAEQGFTIGDVDLATLFKLNANTDKPIYNINDRVVLEMVIQNLSQVTPIANSQLQAVIADPEGNVIFDGLFNPAAMAPGQVLRFEDLMLLSKAMVGEYSFITTLKNSEGNTVATVNTGFEVVDDPRAALAGAVSVESTHIDAGDPQVCDYSLSNESLSDLEGVTWSKVLVQVGEQLVIDQITRQDSIVTNDTLLDSHVISTSNLPPGGYACVLEALIEGEPTILASATFVVGEQDLQISAEVLSHHTPRFLVLVDGISGDDPGLVSLPTLSAQLTALETLLSDFALSYTIVSSESSFYSELLSGNYNQYAILSENISISDATAELLRSKTFLGDGLLVTPEPLINSVQLQSLFGTKPAQQQIDPTIEPTQLNIVDDRFGLGLFTSNLNDLLTPLHTQQAEAHAYFELAQDWYSVKSGVCVASNSIPAIASVPHGNGKLIVGGFDWALEGANDQVWQSLLINGLQVAAPSSGVYAVGDRVIIPMHLSSASGANGRISFVIPDDVIVEGTGPWSVDGNIASVEFALSASEEAVIQLPLVALAPTSAVITGSLEVNGAAVQPVEFALDVSQRITASDVSQALSDAFALYPNDPWVQLAQHSISRLTGAAETDLSILIEARNWLDKSTNDLTSVKETLARFLVRQHQLAAAN